jgi:tetratricopeptide (TPR) repeat protein
LKRAFEFFDKALRLKPHNGYAAVGLALIAAEEKNLSKTIEILTQVHEVMPISSITLCFAHYCVEAGHRKKAIALVFFNTETAGCISK